MNDIDRRTWLKLISAAPVAAGFAWTDVEAQTAHQHAQAARATAQSTRVPFKPKFFTRLTGPTKRDGNPKLRAIVEAREGDVASRLPPRRARR